jgi:multiple sugar transport system permease protein
LIASASYRPGDVAVLISKKEGSDIFRARIKTINKDGSFILDFNRELPQNVRSVPDFATGICHVKIFGQDSYIVKLTRFDLKSGAMREAGFIPLFGNSWLYMYGWLNGGEFMTQQGENCTLNDPKIVEALKFVTDMYDCLGGVEKAMVFQTSSATSMMDLFLNDRIIMKIDGDWFMQVIGAYKPNISFGACPSPMPESRLKAGEKPIGWMGGWAYAIPSTAKQKDGAWELMRWFCSEKANRIAAQFKASVAKSQGKIYFPVLHPDKKHMQYVKREFVDKSDEISDDLKNSFAVFMNLLPNSRHRPITPAGQILWNEHVRSAENAIAHLMTAQEALDYGTLRVQQKLDVILHPPSGPIINWSLIIGAYVLFVLLVIGALAFWGWRRDRIHGALTGKWYEGYIAAAPWLIGFFTFGAGPIIFSIIISFSYYDILNPASFIGLENYQKLFADPIFWLSLRNTSFMIIAVPLGLVAGLLLALLLSHNLKGINFYRTIYYLPAIVPAVATFILWMKILDPDIGLLNHFLRSIGFTDVPNWLSSPVWAKPSIILMGLWGVGGGMVIWLAGIKNIPDTLYEAAAIDGANAWRRFIHITLPMLTPYIFFNLIMGMIGTFQIFEQAYIMTGGGPQDSTLFYAYKLFNEAFRYLNMGGASAMAWILFVIVVIVTGLNFWISKKWVHYN